MYSDAEDLRGGLDSSRPRTLSQHSTESSKHNFPLMTSDSGLYTCSSNNSDCSLALESDIESESKVRGLKDERLRVALQDVRKLRSELERLTKSEQWYKQELRHQKSTRLEDLERIYTQERKFMQENQRLQKECVRLYEKCSDLEKELEQQRQEANEQHVQHMSDEDVEESLGEFEKEQQFALIKDQQQLITVLRKQKRSLLEDLRCLTEEKDEKVMELQRLLADLEFDNKLITKKCTQYAKERLNLENNLKQSDYKLSIALADKLNLQKTLVDLKEQLDIQNQLVKLKEHEIEHIKQHYTDKIQKEQDLDKVHSLSIKYQEEINARTLEIIALKSRLNEMQNELEDVQKLQQQNDQQQRHIEQLNFSLAAFHKELHELKASEELKDKQLHELHCSLNQLLKDKEVLNTNSVEQQHNLFKVQQELKNTTEKYVGVLELYKKTQFQVELLEIEQAKLTFQTQRDHQEIEQLRQKLKEYLKQTAELSNTIQGLEAELQRSLIENSQLKYDTTILMPQKLGDKQQHSIREFKENQQEIENDFKGLTIQDFTETETSTKGEYTEEDEDLQKLTQQSNKLQENLDRLNDTKLNEGKQTILQVFQDFMKKIEKIPIDEELLNSSENPTADESLEKDQDLLKLTQQSNKLLENLDLLNGFFKENDLLINNLQSMQHSNEGMEKLVTENKILKKKLSEVETEAVTLQLKQDINEKTQKCTKLTESLQLQKDKVEDLQEKLLKNDANLYKMERKLKILQESINLNELQKENVVLKQELITEQTRKTDLNKKLLHERELVKELRQTLAEIKSKQRPAINMAIQCDLEEDQKQSTAEVDELKQQIFQLQEQQRNFLATEALRKEERLQLLHKMMDLQNTKMQSVQQHQQEWEDLLKSLNYAQTMEEQMHKELELKRRELEDLNEVFAEQNEELRKLEEFSALIEFKRQHEKENLKLAFQQEINVMKQHLKECQQEIEQQKLVNQELEKRNERIPGDYNEDYAEEVAAYKQEIRALKSQVAKTLQEKDQLLEHLRELEEKSMDFNQQKREAIYLPALALAQVTDIPVETSKEDVAVLKQNISEDHLRILTKVLEAEYQRKMHRYDEHIHSLLTNVKALKKSLRANEEKTTTLSEEHLQTKEELKDLQKTKRNLEEMRLKYEQSQTTIKELKQALAFERQKFELSDNGKSSQNIGNTYEVANLIDDYKKLIQQSALATNRPTTSAILELMQRSNQCVPNLQKLETNVVNLRSDLQQFLTSFSQKMPVTSLITAASLSLPPSLMDELRVASDGY